ncbi:MAG: alanine--tRNA ligase-related protein, partial [Candidatus Omnitrophota bacterium]|nr:alanine--tRNA ligase-related protein [Candidatus Omnitrophota bacterium]
IKEIIRGLPPEGTVPEKKLLYAVADHLRAVAFAIYDGISPSNEGRGYIVRKIIRKSVLHLRSLGINKPFLNKLVGQLAQIMHTPYPDLKDKQEDIARVILNEENNFINILKLSDKYLTETFIDQANMGDAHIVAGSMFKLTDTYGLPLEIIVPWLKKRKFFPDRTMDLYNKKLEEQRERSKAKSAMKGEVFDTKGLGVKLKETKFVGYKENSAQAKILAILKDGKEVILGKTPFYAESGGQAGDTGKLINGKNVFEVLDTQKIDKVIVHIGKVISGSFKKGDLVKAEINSARRMSITRNHTATHILQAALRKVLGAHVQQQGSLVAEEKFRFDFT